MTLIVSALSNEVAVLVADRRVTLLSTGALIDDDRNKVVLYQGAFAFFFTGLAEVGGLAADEWLARTLADGRVGPEALGRVAERATAHFATLSGYPPAWRRQAFCGVGWAAEPLDRLVPVWITISNALDGHDEWLPEARDAFDVRIKRMPPRHAWILCPPIGTRVHPGVLRSTRRNLRHALRRGAVPASVVLADAVRSAAQSAPSVGRQLTGVVLPKPMRGREWRLSAPPLWLASQQQGPMAFDMDATRGDFRWHLPIMAFERQVGLGSVVEGEARALRSVTARFTTPPPGTKVGIGLRGSVSGKQMLVGIDEHGQPFVETFDGPDDKGPGSSGGAT